MFDSLLGGKFSKKCKHYVKCINSRVELIRRKKQATVKILKKDVADLLANGHDSNAFGRIESLLVEMNHASCYDMIEKYCHLILTQLPCLQKQRECPEEAKEGISTLIFAAARFSDLPELYDLRRVFTERYGSNMESSVNPKFVERTQKKSFPSDEKIQLMQDIAWQYSVKWDHKAFQNKISNPSASSPVKVPSNKNEQLSHTVMNKQKEKVFDVASEINGYSRAAHNVAGSVMRRREAHFNTDVTASEIKEAVADSAPESRRSRSAHNVTGSVNSRRETIFNRDAATVDNKKAVFDAPPEINGQNKSTLKVVNLIGSRREAKFKEDVTVDQKREADRGEKGVFSAAGGSFKFENEVILDAYVTVNARKQTVVNPVASYNTRSNADRPFTAQRLLAEAEPRDIHVIPVIRNGKRSVGPDELENLEPEFQKYEWLSGGAEDTDHAAAHEEQVSRNKKTFDTKSQDKRPSPLPSTKDATRPMRMIPPPYTKLGFRSPLSIAEPVTTGSSDNAGSDAKLTSQNPRSEEVVDYDQSEGATSSDQRKHGSRRSSSAYDGDCDEEEAVIDRLLLHLSKKGMKPRMRPPADATTTDTSEPVHRLPPQRVVSLPPERTNPVADVGVNRRPPRAISMNRVALSPGGGRLQVRVLPDYDDVAAKFIALRNA